MDSDDRTPEGKVGEAAKAPGVSTAATAELDEGRVRVEHEGVLRPFMRGILVHSLMDRGMGFDDAYEAAGEVYEKIRMLGVVPRADLGAMVTELCGPPAQKETDTEPGQPQPAPLIEVVEPDREAFPFSKGTLSQSLLAAALDPLANAAHQRLVV